MGQDFQVIFQRWTISEILEQICSGRYGLPEFQRTFVWDEDKTLNLWDSLYRKMPIGQLLLWEVPHESRADFPMRPLARVQNDLDPEAALKVTTCVVDGQQRLSAIYLTLKGELETPLAFDLRERKFTYSKTSPDVVSLHILMHQSFDDARDNDWFKYVVSQEQKNKYARELGRLNAMLTNATVCQIPAQVIRYADYDTVTNIFRRVNVGGEPLSDSQLALASISKKWKGVFKRTYDTLARLDQAIGFGNLRDPDFVLQAWTAVHTGSHKIAYLAPDERSKFAKIATEAKYRESWARLDKGLTELAGMVREFLRLDNFQFVRATYPFVVVTNYLAQHDVGPEDKERLARWIVASILTARYAQKATTKLREDIRNSGSERVLSDLFSYKPYGLDPATYHIESVELSHEEFRAGQGPYATLLYLLMRRADAVDFYVPTVRVGARECSRADLDTYLFPHTADGKELYDLYDGGAEKYKIRWHFHHVFPQALFDDRFAELKARIRDAEDPEEANGLEREWQRLKTQVSSVANLAFLLPPTNILISNEAPPQTDEACSEDNVRLRSREQGGCDRIAAH